MGKDHSAQMPTVSSKLGVLAPKFSVVNAITNLGKPRWQLLTHFLIHTHFVDLNEIVLNTMN